jgi:hypothetical protein
MKGLVVSRAPEEALVERIVDLLGGEVPVAAPDLMFMLFMALRSEGVSGVCTSERARWREGVFGFIVVV